MGIFTNDRINHNKENLIILNKAEQYILKDTTAKFGFALKSPGFTYI